MPARTALLVMPFAAVLLLAACSQGPAPDQPKSPASPVGATELRDTIQKPINKAKGVEGVIQNAHDKQDQQLQKEEGGDAGSASHP